MLIIPQLIFFLSNLERPVIPVQVSCDSRLLGITDTGLTCNKHKETADMGWVGAGSVL